MSKISLCFICISCILLGAVLIAGCSDQSSQEPVATPTLTPTPAPTPIQPKFSDGAVITASSSGATIYYLIMGYDSATDKYSVAQIKQNPSGRWGYRPDNTIDKRNRLAVENIYKYQITTVDPDSIEVLPTATPTPVATATKVKVTATATVTATPTATPTATSTTTGLAPLVKKTNPDSGVYNTNLTGVQIDGANFVEGATVQLTSTGNSPIDGKNVKVTSSTHITCDFSIGDVPHIAWNVVVKNPDGQSGVLSNYFTVTSIG